MNPPEIKNSRQSFNVTARPSVNMSNVLIGRSPWSEIASMHFRQGPTRATRPTWENNSG